MSIYERNCNTVCRLSKNVFFLITNSCFICISGTGYIQTEGDKQILRHLTGQVKLQLYKERPLNPG